MSARSGESERERNPDGSVSLVTKVAGEAYAIGQVLGLGGEAEIVRPEGMRRRLAERVEELGRVYRQSQAV